MSAPRWRLELTAARGKRWTSPPDVRLRRAVKALGRSYGLRVVGCQEVEPPNHQTAERRAGDYLTPAWLAYYHDHHEAGRLPFGEGFPGPGEVTCSTCGEELSANVLLYEWLDADGNPVELLRTKGGEA